MIRLTQDKISSSLKKSSKHFILAKFEMVSGLHLLSLQTGPLRYSVHRFVEPSLFSHVLDAEDSGRRDIITSSKGFVTIHVLLDIIESNALFFKSTWIWVSKWGTSPVKQKHSFILSSWISKRVERWWQFIESVNCICTTVYHQFIGFKWNSLLWMILLYGHVETRAKVSFDFVQFQAGSPLLWISLTLSNFLCSNRCYHDHWLKI